MNPLTELVIWCYLLTNTARVIAYLPQIRAAWVCANGAQSISLATWGYFATAHLSGALYAFIVVHDLKMMAIFLGNLIACVTLLAIITWKRGQQRKRHLEPTDHTSVRIAPQLGPHGE